MSMMIARHPNPSVMWGWPRVMRYNNRWYRGMRQSRWVGRERLSQSYFGKKKEEGP